MGDAAVRVQTRIRERLADARPAVDWRTEYDVGGTPVDVAGVHGDGNRGGDGDEDEGGDSSLVLVELEWRRADPANNTVKLFRNLADGDLGGGDDVRIVQVFTRYYDLQRGGVSTKRRNATFVGDRVARTFPAVTYDAVTLDVDPPKRGGALPDGWRAAVDRVVDAIVSSE
ncbi:hypothetical protein [Halobaculum sp. P14]|uniref:hypothetical protein n=1 Tax=Halobaculum sp. P14 TaxID=3421638 RepID=UPI003EBE9F7F